MNYNQGKLLLEKKIEDFSTNKEEYLSALCQKGGFNPNLWREKKLKLSGFTATVFSEKEMGLK